jgi:EmrB/QacA subfamily drug resistance transporter
MTPSTAAHDPSRQLLPFRESLLAMVGVAFVAMLVALDQTIVGTALPRIVAELKGFDLYAWVATSYMLASVVTIPIFGRLGDLFGRKPFLLAAVIVFTGASVLCGVATNMLFLVIARGLQGIGGGILVGTMFATVADLFPDPKLRLRWLVFVTSAFGLANIVGPTLGGVLTQYGGWRLVFFVNVPVGLLSLLFVYQFLPHLRRARTSVPVRLDWLGAVVLAVTFGALQLLIELLPKEGLSTATMVLASITAACALTLWLWEKRMAYPIVPVDMLLDRKLSALFAMSVLGGFTLFSLVFYVPLLFQGGYAMTPHASGMLITPLLLGTTLGSVLNNRIVTRIRRANGIMYIGFALSALASLAVVALRGHEPHDLFTADRLARSSRRSNCIAAIASYLRRHARHGDDRGIARPPVCAQRTPVTGLLPGNAMVQVVCESGITGGPRGTGRVDQSPRQRWPCGRRDDEFSARCAGRVDSRGPCNGGDGSVGRARPRLVCAARASELWRCRDARQLMPDLLP